jgi:hypothetical protein
LAGVSGDWNEHCGQEPDHGADQDGPEAPANRRPRKPEASGHEERNRRLG